MRRAWIPIAALLAGCTFASVDDRPGAGRILVGQSACLGFCPPDRDVMQAALHEQCDWPSVPAILARGTRRNGLMGEPHRVWRFTCLTVPER